MSCRIFLIKEEEVTLFPGESGMRNARFLGGRTLPLTDAEAYFKNHASNDDTDTSDSDNDTPKNIVDRKRLNHRIVLNDLTTNDLIVEFKLVGQGKDARLSVEILGSLLETFRGTCDQAKVTLRGILLYKRGCTQPQAGKKRNVARQLIWNTEKMEISPDFTCTATTELEDAFKSLWMVDENEFQGNISIYVTLCATPNRPGAAPLAKKTRGDDGEGYSVIGKVLEEGVPSDAVIIAKGGVEVKCHKRFLRGHSPVLAEKLQKSNRIMMEWMSVDGVKALLAYLYYWEKDNIGTDLGTAWELWKAGYYFIINPLKFAMEVKLLRMDIKAFTISTALEIFRLAMDIAAEEQPTGLRMKAVEVLELNPQELRRSDEYKDLFTTHPELAMELCNYFVERSSKKRKRMG